MFSHVLVASILISFLAFEENQWDIGHLGIELRSSPTSARYNCYTHKPAFADHTDFQ
jgi:hypothetical protein